MYGDRPRARATDPQTSHAAAASLHGGAAGGGKTLRLKQQAVLTVLKHAPAGGLTDHELAEVYARWVSGDPRVVEQSPSGLRTRRAELTAMGLVLDTGERRALPSGRRGIVWAARGHYRPPEPTP